MTERHIREMEFLLQLALETKVHRRNGTISRKSPANLPDFTESSKRNPAEPIAHDLDAIIDPVAGGLFSLAAFLDLNEEERVFFSGRSLTDVFLDPSTPVEILERLKNLGKTFLLPSFPERLRHLGKALYFCSVASAKANHGANISSLNDSDYKAGIKALEDSDGLPLALSELCHEVAADFEGLPRK